MIFLRAEHLLCESLNNEKRKNSSISLSKFRKISVALISAHVVFETRLAIEWVSWNSRRPVNWHSSSESPESFRQISFVWIFSFDIFLCSFLFDFFHI